MGGMKGRGAILLVGAAAAMACTSTKMVQRQGCWVKQTERTLGGSSEELGFCTKPAPEWAQDRLARLVQECIAQSDYRWENRALLAWSRNQPIPPPESDESIAKICMSQASAALGMEVENGALKSRLAEMSHDRDALTAVTDQDRAHLQESSDKMVAALGEAAKKPAPSATATATSTGTAKTESDLRSAPQPGQGAPVVVTAPAAPVVVTAPAMPVAPVATCPAGKVQGRKLASGKTPACAPAPDAEQEKPAAAKANPETVMR
jgi:hypothetical protein